VERSGGGFNWPSKVGLAWDRIKRMKELEVIDDNSLAALNTTVHPTLLPELPHNSSIFALVSANL
jgi:hypothetical protein